MIHAALKKEPGQMKCVSPLRTLIVDDSLEFLGQLEKWLSAHQSFEIVGKASSGFEAIEQSRVLRPDLVVMDVAMPLMNGYEATVRIKEDARSPTVILISFFDREEAHQDSDSKADAYIRKDWLYEELLPTVVRLFPLQWEQGGANL